ILCHVLILILFRSTGCEKARQKPGNELEAQTDFASSFGKRLDAAMVNVGTTVEDNFRHASRNSALCNELANGGRSSLVSASLERTLQVLLKGRCSSQRTTGRVVDDLRIDMLRRTVNRQTRTAVRDLLDLTTDARGALLDGFLGSHDMYSLPCKTRTAICGSSTFAELPQPRLVALILLLLAVLTHNALVGI